MLIPDTKPLQAPTAPPSSNHPPVGRNRLHGGVGLVEVGVGASGVGRLGVEAEGVHGEVELALVDGPLAVGVEEVEDLPDLRVVARCKRPE